VTELRYRFPDHEFADWEALHALLSAAFAPMAGRIDPPSSMNRLTPGLLAEKAGDELLLTCMSGDRLVATAFVRPEADWAYIGKIAVHENWRRRGVARRIFDLVEAHGRKAGWSHLELQARVELTENIATFGALGFIETARTTHAGYDRPTSVTMQKNLA
jgi:GNAT superfamily N-acetyltransferase